MSEHKCIEELTNKVENLEKRMSSAEVTNQLLVHTIDKISSEINILSGHQIGRVKED